MSPQKIDVLIIGAGAAGLMCAIEAGKRGRQVLVIDHVNKPGKKILMSGGGRCNFTNYHIHPDAYLSHNPHFCKSALKRYTQWDFIELVKQYQIPFHEKTLGQLFCDDKSKAILTMLLAECEKYHVTIQLSTSVESIKKIDQIFQVKSKHTQFDCQSLVIATGGLSIPTLGATPFGYQIAEQFSIPLKPTRAGLVPFTLQPTDLQKFSVLSGVAVNSIVSTNKRAFHENILFTHRGLSGPAILQLSSYWQNQEMVSINLLPEINVLAYLTQQKFTHPQKPLKMAFMDFLPKRVIDIFIPANMINKNMAEIAERELHILAKQLNQWSIKPNGTEGYRTAEVTLGGVDCDALSSKTMEAVDVKGLYFIGEVVDVTGWLGGYNFQWAWSSGYVAGQVV